PLGHVAIEPQAAVAARATVRQVAVGASRGGQGRARAVGGGGVSDAGQSRSADRVVAAGASGTHRTGAEGGLGVAHETRAASVIRARGTDPRLRGALPAAAGSGNQTKRRLALGTDRAGTARIARSRRRLTGRGHVSELEIAAGHSGHGLRA